MIISILTRAQTAIGQFARHHKCVKKTVYTSCLAYFASFVSVKFMQIRYIVKLSVLHECNWWACDSLHELVTRNCFEQFCLWLTSLSFAIVRFCCSLVYIVTNCLKLYSALCFYKNVFTDKFSSLIAFENVHHFTN